MGTIKHSPAGAGAGISLVGILALTGLLSLTVLLSRSEAFPVITAGPAATPAEVFVGEEVRFSVDAMDDAGLALSYRWRFGDSSAGTVYGPSKTAAYRYNEVGHYRASIYVRNSDGEFVNDFIPVTVITKPTAIRPTASSSIILDTARERVWCVNPDHGTVSAMDARTRALLFEVQTGNTPQTLALAKDGTVWVANRGSGTLSILSGLDGTLLRTLALPYGSRPHGLVFNPSGTEGYVALEGSGRLARLDPAGRRVAGETVLGPSPRAVAVSADGKRILVTRFISPADHAEVWEVSAESFLKVRTFNLAHENTPDTETGGSGILNYLNAVAISPDGKTAAVPGVKPNTRRGRLVSGVDLIPENTARSAIAYIDLEANTENPDARNDFDNSSMPSCAVYSPSGDLLFTCLEGSNAVHARDPLHGGSMVERNRDVGATPIGAALDPRTKTLYVHSFLDRSVSAWNVGVFNTPESLDLDSVVSLPLGMMRTSRWEPLPPQVLQGKRIFYDATDTAVSFNGYINCAVCHLDGGSDGRVWDFTDRGEGLRRTTSLLGRAGTGHGPVHWSANFDEIQDFENDIRGPFGGTGLMADAHFQSGTRSRTLGDAKKGLSPELDALAAYVTSLAKVNPSPYRNPDGTLTADALAGKALFESARTDCTRCHGGANFTDSRLPSPAAKAAASAKSGAGGPAGGAGGPVDGAAQAFLVALGPGDVLTPEGFLVHDVGTLKPSSGHRLADTLKGIDTPTLKGIWETGPYLHDGSAPTLADVIGPFNAGDRHGKTSGLTAREKEQLVAFLLQLDDGPLSPPIVGVRPGPLAARLPGRLVATASGIRLQLPGAYREARITLHDMRGRQVEARFQGRPGKAGEWEWNWDGREAESRTAGMRLTAGMYTVRIRAKGAMADLALPLAWTP